MPLSYGGVMRRALALAALLSLPLAGAARAQPVEVTALAAPDAFSNPGRETGLPADLWRDASAATVRAVLPKLATAPLSKAAQALARRVLATGAPGPQGIGDDAEILSARARALAALGDTKAASAVLARARGMDRSPELSRQAAESALLAGEDARACALAEGLSVGREDVYWLRLRAYCQAIGGHADQAQLTYDLAQAQARDATFGRLMGAKLAGLGDPGPASLRDGLDYALSRNLGLDLHGARPTAALAAALAGDPVEPAWPIAAGDGPAPAAAQAIAGGGAIPAETVAGLLDAAAKGHASAPAAVIVAAYAGAETPPLRAALAALEVSEGRSAVGRNLAMEDAARAKLAGETAMLALWSCAEAGQGGLAAGERARIVRALRLAGLDRDARNFALEGLLAP